jgi:hypothetical protein
MVSAFVVSLICMFRTLLSKQLNGENTKVAKRDKASVILEIKHKMIRI